MKQGRDGNLITFASEDNVFTAILDFTKQVYTIFKDGKFLITCYRFVEVKNYLA
jgi:hypothetical protein